MARRPMEQNTELNLIPVMNLMSVTIPFLVMGAQFVEYSSMQGAMARIGARPAPGIEAPVQPLGLQVAISAEGLGLSVGAGATGGAQRTVLPCAGPCRDVDAYDWAGLNRRLAALKDQHPDELTAVVAPSDDIRYELLIRAMEACREERLADGSARVLFPRVLIAPNPGSP